MFTSLPFILAWFVLALSDVVINKPFKQLKWVSEKSYYWAKWCDWYGNDLQSYSTPRDQCALTCADTNGCTHFTWTNYAGGSCWMKKGPVSFELATEMFITSANKGLPLPDDDSYSICGLMKTAITNTVTPASKAPVVIKTAKTKRHWDCCKPSCAWPGKADVTEQVMSCRGTGWDWNVNVPYAPDACHGGTAYTCNQFQPIVKSDYLAYVFASASLNGLSERELCCACFELTPTNTALRGKKKIIVQVVSAAVNFGLDYFSLMIPGGGVGMFNGCDTLFHAPKDGWGDRHKGISDRSRCQLLPNELLPGCYWRFDWFWDAENPNVNYTRVTCPNDFIYQSNCRRLDE